MCDQEIMNLTHEIEQLKSQLALKEKLLHELKSQQVKSNKYTGDLDTFEVSRYSRQMLIPSIGVLGQLKLKNARVLIIGIGGLGCPAALYLASAGVGHLTLVDSDEVEVSNLHRQILHTEFTVGLSKVESAYKTLISVNSNIDIKRINQHVTSGNIEEILSSNYDVVIDGSDNVPTRYLINDACVMRKTPLVSGSALQLEGQLTVYNYKDGPCYRCLYPVPPPPHTVTSCGDGGVLGTIPGVIGILQALETIKIILKEDGVLSGRLLLFDGRDSVFKNVKLRSKQRDCKVCSIEPEIATLVDYEQFCGAKAHDKVENIDVLKESQNIDAENFARSIRELSNVVLDVRPKSEFEMCRLPNSTNVPLSEIENGQATSQLENVVDKSMYGQSKVFVICRRGNDSQRAVNLLNRRFSRSDSLFVNVRGGLHAYSRYVDPTFPIY